MTIAPVLVALTLSGLFSTTGSASQGSLFAGLALATGDDTAVAPLAAVSRGGRGIDADLASATFDEAWGLIERTHFDPTFNGVDWHALRDELRPRAQQAATMGDLRAVIQDMLDRLGQSHFGLLPGDFIEALEPGAEDDALDETDAGDTANAIAERPVRRRTPPERPGDVGIDVRLIDGQIVVTSVTPGSPAHEAGVRTGWVVTAIGRRNLADLIDLIPDHLDERMVRLHGWRAAISRLTGEQGTTVGLTLLDERNEERTAELQRVPIEGERIKFGDLPTSYAAVKHERITTTDEGGAERSIGYISFNIWMVPISEPFERAVDELRDADGIILDLRGNPGGVAGLAMGVAGHFLDDRLTLGTMNTRYTTLRIVANPRQVTADGRRVSPFNGPLAILVDAETGSTSEMFAAGMQGLGRAKIFGETTMGAVLPAMMSRLPNGDVLMHAFANFVDPHGEPVEGRGTIPDVYAPHTRERLLAGRDAAREAAVEWILSHAESNDSTPCSH